MNAGIEALQLTSTGTRKSQYALIQADIHLRAGRPAEAMEALSTGLQFASDNAELTFEPELYQFRGELLIAQGEVAEGEASLVHAVELARSRQARMQELRAALPLAKVWRASGRTKEISGLLEPLERWFREHGDVPELHEVRAILKAIGSSNSAVA